MGQTRAEASILHLDLDAFFAAVEQRDKPSLRGKPVVVGGIGGRGVVATASYEARAYGVHSAMPTAQARRLCPHAAYLGGRFGAYRKASEAVMARLRQISPLVEPLSLDEAFVDLRAGEGIDFDIAALNEFGRALKADIAEVTGGLCGSIGIATSKLLAKIASDLEKPDGLVVIAPGLEAEILAPMSIEAIPGIGPATSAKLHRHGIRLIGDLQATPEDELVGLLGPTQGTGLARRAWARDDRPVVAEREAKSVSVEDTYETDQADLRVIDALLTRQAAKVAQRLERSGLSGRTISVKVRLYDFSTHTRSTTLPAPTASPATIARVARSLIGDFDTGSGVRLLGVGVSGLSDWIQDDLFADQAEDPSQDAADDEVELAADLASQRRLGWIPGADVEHLGFGRGWVWGSGRGRVTVRFETAETGPGPVRTFAADDPQLSASGS
ncbi:MAG: DNA polymerase IV [Marmoricola sp.]